jgi:hypothetical protein
MTLINRSWLELKPNEDNDGNQEEFKDYYPRIKLKRDYKHIPMEDFEQWIHPLHNNNETLRNYSWLNYENIEFAVCEWDFEELSKVHVIEEFQDYYNNRSIFSDFDQFCCCKEDLKCWENNGTWRTPPIILDVESLKSRIPEWSEIISPYQLVEGHSRLGYLKSTKKIAELKKGKIAQKHRIFLMKEKNTNAGYV